MKPAKSSSQLLDIYYNDLRSHFLEAAATLDRLDRANIQLDSEANMKLQKLLHAAKVLEDNEPQRAKRFLEALSEN